MPRTIEDIIPPSRRRTASPAIEEEMDMRPRPPARYGKLPKVRRRLPWGTALIVLIVILVSVGVLYALSGARVEVNPVANAGAVSGTYTATPNSGDLPFQVITAEKIATQSVAAESTITASDAAQGSVTIYNEQAKSQELIKNTRFQTSGGLVFRIHDSVTVPAGSALAPGKVDAVIFADSPGTEYNVGPTTFSVPGLADTPQFKQVYAKSAVAMAGGFSGTRPSVAKATSDSIHTTLQGALATDIEGALTSEVPEGYVLVPGSTFTSYSPLPDAAGEGGKVDVKEKATALAAVFPADAFARAVARSVVGNSYGGQPVMLKSVDTLTLNAASSTPPSASAPFTFSLSGNATVVWSVDAPRIAGAIAGKNRTEAKAALAAFPEIAGANLILRPFWVSTFPADPADIKVVVNPI